MSPSIPHGGQLVNRILRGHEREMAQERAQHLPRIQLDEREVSDLEMIATGALSPLTGFMNREDYHAVLDTMRLANGLVWTLPVTLSVSREEAEGLREGQEVVLVDSQGTPLALMEIQDRYPHDKQKEALEVYRTDSLEHPGVRYLQSCGEVLLGGPIWLFQRPRHQDFLAYRLDPEETRRRFRERGWRRVVGFQTRNPIHRAHEYIQKTALEIVDGLLVHPLVGATKKDDIPADVRMRCYEVLLSNTIPRIGLSWRSFPRPCGMPAPGRLSSTPWCGRTTAAPIS